MKTLLDIEKRLVAAEKNESKRGKTFVLKYCSRANALAYVFSNCMPNEEPNVFELHWPEKPPTTDAIKLKLLAQIPSDRIDAIRVAWAKSPWQRDKIALRELNRLLALGG